MIQETNNKFIQNIHMYETMNI